MAGPVALLTACAIAGPAVAQSVTLAGSPRSYVCLRASSPPSIDGRLDDVAWQAARWSDDFVDIEGEARPRPHLRTRMKLLWDDAWLYVAAELEEPHVWATLTERDAVIWQDDDFEVFLDPDGDTHEYYEIEINALGTVFDLFLVRPYRDGGPALHAWDAAGLRAAVAVDGTVNEAADRDRGWSVELAIPWSVLAEASPTRRRPGDGEHWRMNFSRVDWTVDPVGGRYAKRIDPATGKPLPESNWVWSPQGAIDMHRPEMWGIVQFREIVAGEAEPVFEPPPDEDIRRALRRVYDAQRALHREHGRYTVDLVELGLVAGSWVRPAGFTLEAGDAGFEATAKGRDPGRIWRIREDGRLRADR